MNIASNWSSFTRIDVVGGKITAPTGEKLALNDTGDGVLVWYTDPYDKKGKLMAVTLANQRIANCVWCDTEYHNIDIPALSNVQSNKYDPNTANYNTSAILTFDEDYATYFQAADVCTRKKINKVSCNLPNKQQLEIIRKVATIIDELDPTAKSNPAYKLSNWGFGSSDAFCWSSSEYLDNSVWAVRSSGSGYYVDYDYKYNEYGVIPILELNPSTLRPI